MTDLSFLSNKCRTAAEWQARTVETPSVIYTDEATRYALRWAAVLADEAADALEALVPPVPRRTVFWRRLWLAVRR